MKVIGITGGVGCGKSAVLDLLLENYNCKIVKADDIGKMVLEPGTKGYEEVVLIFGDEILMDDQSIDRNRLAQIVFSDPRKLQVLNSIVHPAVRQWIIADMTKEKIHEAYDYYFLETAILYDVHYENFCDEVWYIYANEDIRRERLMESRHYSKEKIDSIMSQQLDDAKLRRKVDHVIDNSDSYAKTMEQIRMLLR